MATRTTRSGVKRSIDADDDASAKHSPKRSKPNSEKAQTKAAKTTAQDDEQSPKQNLSCDPDMNANSNPKDSPNPTKQFLTLTESTGDIFDAPPGTLLIHACNCEGSWGAGIAAAFRKNYPSAFETYSTHCSKNDNDFLFSRALLIPPEDPRGHFIGCLFTSRSKGKKKDSPEKILEATGPAMRDLLEQVGEYEDGDELVKEVRMRKINSGLFRVPWEETRKVLEGVDVYEGGFREVKVVSREE